MVGTMFARRLSFLVLTLGLFFAFAAPPPFPENTVGAGYANVGRGVFQASMVLPFNPMGLEAGSAFYLASDLDRWDGYLDLELLIFPGLAVGPAFGEAGGFFRLDGVKDAAGFGVGAALGLSAGLEFSDPLPFALFGRAGLGYLRGFRLAWGVGVRVYPAEVLAIDLGADDRLGLYAALSYLW